MFEIYLSRVFAVVYFVWHSRPQLDDPDSKTLASGPADPCVIENG